MRSEGPTWALPHPALRNLVTGYHGYRYAGLAAGVHHGLPSTELTVVIAFDEPLDVSWMGDPGSRGRHWAMTSGLHTAPAAIHHDGTGHGLQLGFTPAGARVLLGLPASAIAREMVPLGELFGPAMDRLYDDVATATTWRHRFSLLDRHLLARAAQGSTGSSALRSEVSWALRRIEAARGQVRVDDLAGDLGWSRRHLGESFRAELGITPKQAARIVRFQHARSLIGQRPAVGLATVAAEAGYADQAHFAREWRALAGCTPTRWLRAELPFVQDTTAGAEAASAHG